MNAVTTLCSSKLGRSDEYFDETLKTSGLVSDSDRPRKLRAGPGLQPANSLGLVLDEILGKIANIREAT